MRICCLYEQNTKQNSSVIKSTFEYTCRNLCLKEILHTVHMRILKIDNKKIIKLIKSK